MKKEIRKYIRVIIEGIIQEWDSNITTSSRYSDIAKKLMGDKSTIVLNKIRLGEELTLNEMDEARENYLDEYIKAKVAIDENYRKINPINIEDLEAVFERGGHIVDNYLRYLTNKYSNVEQISNTERASLLNFDWYDIPHNASEDIAKKYIVKMLSNIDVPQANDNKWTKDDSAETWKAYTISMSNEVFRDVVMQILAKRGKHNSSLYKRLKKLKEQIPNEPESFE